MRFTPQSIPDVILVEPTVFQDDRGFFLESYHAERFAAGGIACSFVQDNHSRSVKGTLRGLHFQRLPGQAKLVRCVRGRIWDVAVDIRPSSPSFGQWVAQELSEENKRMLFVPVGFAHGFAVLSEQADVLYKCSHYYEADTEAGLAWDDPDVALPWPVQSPLLSGRDLANPTLRRLFPERFHG
ncbi:MAG: dTDP-4-dehydrorhamnose 3,5-epimerase [Anaerolineae bacterium]|nr:dTDP-4-dehydrorhamnose 3,5-epimerase [Ardenticatenia bacterium]HQZ69843.1 dTDP-4-dehydrorhamnose 3,5-epimerase [Anaerolineae bacterium]HRA20784.1 dTDP-4-dehydrorhamnose 3,5-epimerase [Anaerolineae bacterium]